MCVFGSVTTLLIMSVCFPARLGTSHCNELHVKLNFLFLGGEGMYFLCMLCNSEGVWEAYPGVASVYIN